jgi:ketosteroid isomerase-like protein
MTTNEEIISRFYRSFNALDAAAMNACYRSDIVFFDPVFDLLNGPEVFAMWEMLCKNAKDFSLTFGDIRDLGEDYYTCDWIATYTFSATGRQVINNVKAHMKIVDGKIAEHSDAFSLHQWSRQALGFSGWLLGWNSYYRQKIKNRARRNLMNYMGR